MIRLDHGHRKRHETVTHQPHSRDQGLSGLVLATVNIGTMHRRHRSTSGYAADEGAWRIAHTFPRGKIEHVHGIIPDDGRGVVWIVTMSDFGESARYGPRAMISRMFVPCSPERRIFVAAGSCASGMGRSSTRPTVRVAINTVRRPILPRRDPESADGLESGAAIEALMEI